MRYLNFSFLRFFLTFTLLWLAVDVFAQTAGSLDPTFGPGGTAANHLNITATLYDMAIQPDKKIVVTGITFTPTTAQTGTVARFNENGTLDTTFAGIGYINWGLMASVNSVQILPDGKMLVGGYERVGTTTHFCVARLNPNGSTDPTFDEDGIVVTTVGTSSEVRAVYVLPDGKILAAGKTRLTSNSTQDIAIVRYNADGSLDTTFGSGGRVATDFGSDELSTNLVSLTDGKFLLGGAYLDPLPNQYDAVIVRYNSNGSIDTTFGDNGRVFRSAVSGNATVNELVVQPDGKILIVGTPHPTRFNSDGTLDTIFTAFGWSSNSALAIQPDGKIVAAGSDGSNAFVTVRYNSDGTADDTFGTNGRITNGFFPAEVALAPDGKIVVGGTRSTSSFEIVLSRYLSTASGLKWMDFDGDRKADVSVFRPSENKWYVLRSTDFGVTQQVFAIAGDVPAPADYDGDGKTDFAIFRPSSGDWWSLSSINGAQIYAHWGANGDIPRPSDYDGDGRADYVVFRPSNGFWYRISSANGATSNAAFGLAGDKPVIGDFDGDGKSDKAIFRPSNGDWWYQSSLNGAQLAVHWGISTDIPAPADFDGDGKTDFAVYRPSTGVWYIINSSNFSFTIMHFGISEDKPVPADYDGDGKADIAVFRPSTGAWYLQQSTAGFWALNWGISTDIPVENAFVP